jgi:conjugative transfer pilus assembly protein TraH
MPRKLTTLLVIASIVSVNAAPALASVGGKMDAFWSDGMAAASVTGPHGAYSGQAGGYYTPGNLSLRVPQETYTMATFSAPSLKGGCGGIDLFGGAFSFIGADQLVAMMKGIAQNAIGYAFTLALQLISAPIADNLKTFENWLQTQNWNNINSCEAATKLVNGGLEAMGAKTYLCQSLGRSHGEFSDASAARLGCSADNALSAGQPTSPEEKQFDPVNRNFAWDAIKAHPILGADHELAQLMMTVTGSLVITCSPSAASASECQTRPLTAKGKDPALMTVLLDGGDIKAASCAGDFDACLNPVEGGLTVHIDKGLKQKAQAYMTRLVTKIRTRTPLDADEVAFVNMTALPVYKMASVYASIRGLAPEEAMGQYAEVVALDVAYAWLERMVSYAHEGSKSIKGMDPTAFSTWQSQIADVSNYMVTRQAELAVKGSQIQDIMLRTQQIEYALQGDTTGRIAQSFAMANSLGSFEAAR